MNKRQFKLNEDEVKELQWAERQCKDGPTRRRYQCVRLYGVGYAVAEIEKITGCSRPSLMEWCRAYRQLGIAGVIDKRLGGNRALLREEEVAEVQALLHTYTPIQLLGEKDGQGSGQFWEVRDLALLVRQRYGVVYKSATSYYQLFAKCDFTRQRPGQQYLSRREEKVAEFEELLEKN
jgi:transposase